MTSVTSALLEASNLNRGDLDELIDQFHVAVRDEELLDQYLFIKDQDGEFKMKLVKKGECSRHAEVFPRENHYRQYGFSYVPSFNIVTIDETLDRAELEEVMAEVWHRLKARPVAIWNGWFRGDTWVRNP